MHYFKQHWNGELTVFRSFCINFLIPFALLASGFDFIVERLFFLRSPWSAWISIVAALGFLLLFIWQCVGVLRSAEHKTLESGERLWSTAASFCIVFAVLLVLVGCVEIFQAVTQLKQRQDALSREVSRSYSFTIVRESQSIRVDGVLDPGVTRELDSLLEQHPDTVTIVLNSSGGQIYEGRGLFRLFERKQLDTRVDEQCFSACTMAFLGGVNRHLGDIGQLGFHQYRTYSIQPNINVDQEQGRDRELMLQQSVSSSFVHKVFDSPPDEMWIPLRQELVDAGVILQTQ